MDDELEEIAAAIEAHLSEHPNAADTAEGIAFWWLPQRHPVVDRGLVEQALQQLVEDGVVTARRVGNGTVIYALNKKAT